MQFNTDSRFRAPVFLEFQCAIRESAMKCCKSLGITGVATGAGRMRVRISEVLAEERKKQSRRQCRRLLMGGTLAHVRDAPLDFFLGWRFWLCRKLEHRCFLALA
jgi:hypothetical protein